jgi:hypothetical protein
MLDVLLVGVHEYATLVLPDSSRIITNTNNRHLKVFWGRAYYGRKIRALLPYLNSILC